MSARRLLTALLIGVAGMVGCFHVHAVPSRAVSGPTVLASSGLDTVPLGSLALQLVCTDASEVPVDSIHVQRCTPCTPLAIRASGTAALAHARYLREQVGTIPYDSADGSFACVKYAYELALADTTIRLNETRATKMEAALFMTWSSAAIHRRVALQTIDATLDTMMAIGDSAFVKTTIELLARSFYSRAEYMYGRPAQYPLSDVEKAVHDLLATPLPFRQLPPLPRASDQLGESEALWAGKLFDRLSSLESTDVAAHARAVRMSITPLVLLDDWNAVDSAAKAILARNPHDSVATLARALAQYHMKFGMVREQQFVMSLFDEAMRSIPRSDSASLDAFDMMMSESDDEWRYQFMPGTRMDLDTRAWAVIDPLWMTPVNEIRLERRARVTESNFLYATYTKAAESGSETAPGRMFVKRGRPLHRWTMPAPSRLFFNFEWPGVTTSYRFAPGSTLWHAFYTPLFSVEQAARTRAPKNASCQRELIPKDLVTCTAESRADFRSVPFYAKTDTIDVTMARFRVNADSVDFYFASRLPMRGFRLRNTEGISKRDSIRYGLWVANEYGKVSYHREHTVPLPRANDVAQLAEWRTRLKNAPIMHRVEALDEGGAKGARGWRRSSSESDAAFSLSGFALSDIMIGDSIRSAGAGKRWSDIRMRPNGGVVAVNAPLAMAWEIYDLQADKSGRLRWKVTVRREDGRMLANNDVRGVIANATSAIDKVIATEPDASTVSYSREAPAAPVVLDYLIFRTNGLFYGNHVLTVVVEDLVAKRTTTRSVAFRVIPANAQGRLSN